MDAMGGDLSLRRDDFAAAIQHDTVLMPHECGGPVVTLDGKIVGINIARAGRTESYYLPADVVRESVDKMLPVDVKRSEAVPASKSDESKELKEQ